ncbi:MAG: SixA phosphatase family protein [Allosphingosinicella sp.]
MADGFEPSTRPGPVNARGRRAARTVAGEMRRLGLGFDRVVASPARRVVETLDEVADAFGPLDPEYDQRLYLAAPDTLLDIVRETPAAVERLLLVAHNPGLERLALRLSQGGGEGLRAEVEIKYPTGTLAELSLPVERWADVADGTATITRFIRPRDLDPELGPDGT